MPSPSLRSVFESGLDAHLAAGSKDPFTNPYLLFALDVTRRMERGEIALDHLGVVISSLCADGFIDRAERLGAYLGEPDPEKDREALTQLFEGLADRGFETFAALLGRPAVGVVTTAHPTFALDEESCVMMVELACRRTLEGEPLDPDGVDDLKGRIRLKPHGPPKTLSLDVEHAWSVRVLNNALEALRRARLIALGVARVRWPDQWTALSPRLMTLATWVGFDQDGRNDVTWLVSIGKRLELKAYALRRLARLADGPAPSAAQRLHRARDVVLRQLDALHLAARDPGQTAAFSRAMVLGRDASLTDVTPLLEDINAALAQAPSLEVRADIIALKMEIEVQGVGLAHIHVRLNAAQLHNAVRREVGLETAPTDPANRRAYFASINRLLEDCQPEAISFQSLLDEPTSAKKLFITIAQMKKFIDGRAPVRFLIAETESGFTLLAALYYARLFGVEDLVEISPLFETAEALERGETVIEEALRSPHFRAYVKRQGRICIEFGFSDSGRFIGQMGATFRIERLRFRLAELLEQEGLSDLEVVLFNTHGDSIGRGGHPRSLQDRLTYAAPPQSRQAFARRGLNVREEDSFQGGDGYLPFFTSAAAEAAVRGLLTFGYAELASDPDPIYDQPDFAADFFAAIQQSFEDLAKDRDYALLLGLYGTRLLNRTGSRPEQRQGEGQGRVRTLSSVAELRAIPNNAILQGLADLANTTFGVARAAAKDPETFAAMMTASPRFSQALEMVRSAAALGDLAAMRAYGAAANPSLWLDRRAGAPEAEIPLLTGACSVAERLGLTSSLSRALRRIRAEPALPLEIEASDRRDRLRLLHAIRIALIQRIVLLAARLPRFTPFDAVTREDVQEQLMRLDVPGAVAILSARFPLQGQSHARGADFGEAATYRPGADQGYEREHGEIFQPLLRLHGLLLQTTTALDQEIGACG